MKRILTLLPLLLVACEGEPEPEPPVCVFFRDTFVEHVIAVAKFQGRDKGASWAKDGLWAEVIATREAAVAANVMRSNADSAHTCACAHWEIAEAAWVHKALNLDGEGLSAGDFQTVSFDHALAAAQECAPEQWDQRVRELRESEG